MTYSITMHISFDSLHDEVLKVSHKHSYQCQKLVHGHTGALAKNDCMDFHIDVESKQLKILYLKPHLSINLKLWFILLPNPINIGHCHHLTEMPSQLRLQTDSTVNYIYPIVLEKSSYTA